MIAARSSLIIAFLFFVRAGAFQVVFPTRIARMVTSFGTRTTRTLSLSAERPDWWTSVRSFVENLNESLQIPVPPPSPNTEVTLREETKTIEEVEAIKTQLREDRAKEKASLASFQAKLDVLLEVENAKDIQERTRLPDPDDLRQVLDATGKPFDACMAALRASLATTSDTSTAISLAVASVSSVDPKALSFVQEKSQATLREAVRALLDVGENDTMAAIIRVREMRVESLTSIISETEDLEDVAEARAEEEWESFRNDMMAFLEAEAKKPKSERAKLPDPASLLEVMDFSGGGFKQCMSVLQTAFERGLDEAAAVNFAKEEMARGDDASGAKKRTEIFTKKLAATGDIGETWKVGDKAGVLSGGEWWVAQIVRIMPRKTGTMFEAKFSDGSKQVVDGGSIKKINENDEDDEK